MRSHLANDLLAEALASGLALGGPWDEVAREVTRGRSRFDFRLARGDQVCWVAAKSVTLVEGRAALFPDAVTARGRRHKDELAAIAATGARAAAVFVVQRADADSFSPHWDNDPAFAQALERAAEAGVTVLAYGCDVSLTEIRIVRPLPMALGRP